MQEPGRTAWRAIHIEFLPLVVSHLPPLYVPCTQGGIHNGLIDMTLKQLSQPNALAQSSLKRLREESGEETERESNDENFDVFLNCGDCDRHFRA
jgi:hypothetical protein